MIANFTPNKSFTIAEKFMSEKLLELFFNRTLDSYRAKLNNPKWILIELYQVLSDWHHGKIKAFDKTIKPVILECLQFLSDEIILEFKPIDTKYYKELLGSVTEKNYPQLSYATKILIESNQHFGEQLFLRIEREISRLNDAKFNVEELETLSKYLDYLATELINKGYSKGYLYSITSRIFTDDRSFTFIEAFTELKSCINREKEEFTVIFKLNKLGGGNKKIDIKSEYELNEERIKEFEAINKKSQEFLSKRGDFCYLLAIKACDHDYLSVIEKAKKLLFTLIDFIHMGYPDNPFDFNKKCLVIGTRKIELTNTQPVFYTPDGSYKNNEQLYELLLRKIKKLSENNSIQKETIQKVISAFRHLRLGRDADELEQKFLNYWIGLEYIFSNYDVNDITIVRLKEYFIHSHSIVYLKRNLYEFHKDIKRLKLNDSIPNLDEELIYLTDEKTYEFIINNFFEGYPLLAFRANKFKELITGPKRITQAIVKHRNNLEWHLSRCYRIRNEIVHDAAIHLNIESITGNLKYYLTYILNGLLEYFDTISNNILMDEQITISDYFLLQEIKYRSLSNSGFQLKDLIAEKSATETFA